jgi:hypothetical protein
MKPRMGQLDEARFEALIGAGCTKCNGRVLELRTFLDRRLLLMLADPNDAGRWVHDGEKFVDGVYQVSCTACQAVMFEDPACPRCHAEGGITKALGDHTRLEIPKRCPKCNEIELLALALVPAKARSGAGTPKPEPLVDFGEAGFHIVAFACENCDAAVVTQKCPLCDATGPLRPRP